ncbi:hypothetical protein FPQ18DRAFT_420358 [Pyronema domesticum]|nr:hypothetical protein FPQ18DRAFT_420358 [Pyronema domesticum]
MRFHKFLGLSLALYPYLTVAAEVGQMRNWWTIDGPGFVDALGQLDALRCFEGSANTTLACDGLVANMTSKGFNEKHGELALTQLSAIEAFTTAFKDSIGDAYKEAANLIAGPELTRKWFTKLDDNARKEFFKKVAVSSLRSIILSEFPWYDWNSSDVPAGVKAAQKKAWSSINGAVSLFGSLVESDTTAIAHHKGVTVDNYFSSVVDGHQHGAEVLAERILENENDIAATWMKYGNVLEAEGLDNLKDELKTHLSRYIFLKAVNQALKDTASYVTCTVKTFKDPSEAPFGRLPAGDTCKYDTSGPADLKSCVDGDVCYLYRWKSVSNSFWRLWNPEHNDKPRMDEMRNAPFSLDPSAVIDSTVVGALQGAVDFRYREDGTPITTNGKTTVQDLGEARVPGMFDLPVCYSNYSWNTPMDPSRRRRGWHILGCSKNDLYCFDMMPPCYCGPWGTQTKNIWSQINIHQKDAINSCDYRIDSAITDVIENYVAKCRLQDSPTGKCKDIIRIIETRGYGSPSEIEPDIKFALTCQVISVGPFTNAVDPRKKTCKMYKKMWEDLKADPSLKSKGALPKEATQDLAKIEAEFKEIVESGGFSETEPGEGSATTTSTDESTPEESASTIETTDSPTDSPTDDEPAPIVATRAETKKNTGSSAFPLSHPSQNNE